jgi:hypothetical protein
MDRTPLKTAPSSFPLLSLPQLILSIEISPSWIDAHGACEDVGKHEGTIEKKIGLIQ